MNSDWNAKKSRIMGIICLVVSFLCFVGFLVSAIANQPSKPEKFLNKYEKLCKEGNAAQIARLYVKDAEMSVEAVDIPYYGYNPEFIYEGIEDLGDKNYTLSYTVYYEVEEEKIVDGEKKNVKVPFSYSGNEVSIRKTLFGYRFAE